MDEINKQIEQAEKSLASIKLAPGPQHQAIISLIAVAKALALRVATLETVKPAEVSA